MSCSPPASKYRLRPPPWVQTTQYLAWTLIKHNAATYTSITWQDLHQNMFTAHKDGKWCATSHTHVAVVQCCHMPARDCLTLNYKLVLVAGMWVGNLAWCWKAHSGHTSFVKEGNDHSLLLLQWSYKHTMNYRQHSLNNHYYRYTTNCKTYVRKLYWKDTSPVTLLPTNQNL